VTLEKDAGHFRQEQAAKENRLIIKQSGKDECQ
jgi:hypothetical protein